MSTLRRRAERIAAGLPAVAIEIVLTGSVSRGADDDLSDVEMLVVTSEQLDLAACSGHAGEVGLVRLDTWGEPSPDASRVFGYLDGTPVELTWWPRDYAQRQVDALLSGALTSTAADGIAHGVALRTTGLLAGWQSRLADYPEALARRRIEDAALAWGGYHPSGLLTLARPGARLALAERLVDDAARVVAIVYALNRTWQPTFKRLGARAEALAVKPERLEERIEDALAEPDAIHAMSTMTALQLDTLALAPPGPHVDRAQAWLTEAEAILRARR